MKNNLPKLTRPNYLSAAAKEILGPVLKKFSNSSHKELVKFARLKLTNFIENKSALTVSLIFLILILVFPKSTQLTATAQTPDWETAGCNEPCQHNYQCQPDHFCFQGFCRLGINPLDPNCDPDNIIPITDHELEIDTDSATASAKSIQDDQLPDPIKDDEDLAEDTMDSDSDIDEFQNETKDELPEHETPNETNDKVPLGGSNEVVDEDLDEDQFLLNQEDVQAAENTGEVPGLVANIERQLEKFDLTLPLALGIGLAGLVLIISLAAILNNNKKSKFKSDNFTHLKDKKDEPQSAKTKQAELIKPSGSPAAQTQQFIKQNLPEEDEQVLLAQEEQIKKTMDRINQLISEEQNSAPGSDKAGKRKSSLSLSTDSKSQTSQSIPASPPSFTTSPTSKGPKSAISPTNNPNQKNAPSSTIPSSSTMMERLKQKGIKIPGQSVRKSKDR